jgi:hypothetical protein
MSVVELGDYIVEFGPFACDGRKFKLCSACVNQSAGRSGQNGGSHTAVLYNGVPELLGVSCILLIFFLRCPRRGHQCGGCLQISFTRNNAVVTSTQFIYYYCSKYIGSRVRSFVMS